MRCNTNPLCTGCLLVRKSSLTSLSPPTSWAQAWPSDRCSATAIGAAIQQGRTPGPQSAEALSGQGLRCILHENSCASSISTSPTRSALRQPWYTVCHRRTMGDASLAIVSSTVSPLFPRIMRAASAADAGLFGLSLTSYGRNFTGSSLCSTSRKSQRHLFESLRCTESYCEGGAAWRAFDSIPPTYTNMPCLCDAMAQFPRLYELSGWNAKERMSLHHSAGPLSDLVAAPLLRKWGAAPVSHAVTPTHMPGCMSWRRMIPVPSHRQAHLRQEGETSASQCWHAVTT